MASSGSFQNAFHTGYTLRVEWTTNSQSIGSNTSTVQVNAYLISGGGSYTINSSVEKTVRLKIDGTTYTKSATNLASLSGSEKKLLFSKTVTIKHSADGTKSLALACEFDIEVTLGGTYYGTVKAPASGTATATLDAIPRATTPTTSGTLNVGSAITINTPRASSAFTHTVQYSLNNSTWTTIATNVGTSTAWTLPTALATAKPGAKSGTVYIRCITYNGDTNLGNVVISRTYYITSNYAAPTVALTASQKNDANISSYIRGRSSVTLKATATLKHGAKAAKFVFTYGGTTKTVTTTSSTASVTFALPENAAASYAYSVTLTDSRGFTASANGTLTTVSYTAPIITSLTVTRGNYNGSTFTENKAGKSLRIVAKGNVANLSNSNAKKYKIDYKVDGASEYTELVAETNASDYAVSVTHYTDALFDENKAYVVRFILKDSFQSVIRPANVSTQLVMLNFSADGQRMGIGKVAGNEPLSFGFETKFLEPVYGTVMGLSYLPSIPSNSDLNTYLSIGGYAVNSNAAAETISNMPIQKAGRLEIFETTGRKPYASTYQYLRQKFTPYSLTYPTYERDVVQSGASTWSYGDWIPTTMQAHEPKVLWSGAWYMTSGHSVVLAEKVSEQVTGICLVFSRITNGTAENSNFNSFFVSKYLVEAMPGMGSCFYMSAVNFSYICSKYLYISDDRITGNDLNSASGTNNGVTYNNGAYALRYVIGV